MASIHAANFTSVMPKNVNNSGLSKISKTVFLPVFDVNANTANLCKKEAHPSCIKVPRATLTFDPPSTNVEKTKQRKNTVDPSAPDFLPLPSFEQCFPKSTKEYRYFSYGSMV
ncbi:putative phosphomethylpyrimidine synthase [Helianthus annuus]|nr:putative phosphomethylpyrimidine synthase [Helianthus annuus]